MMAPPLILAGLFRRCGALAEKNREGQNIRLEEVHDVLHGHWLFRMNGN